MNDDKPEAKTLVVLHMEEENLFVPNIPLNSVHEKIKFHTQHTVRYLKDHLIRKYRYLLCIFACTKTDQE